MYAPMAGAESTTNKKHFMALVAEPHGDHPKQQGLTSKPSMELRPVVHTYSIWAPLWPPGHREFQAAA